MLKNKILILGGTGMVGKNLQQSFEENKLNGIFIGRGKNSEFDLTDQYKTKNLFSYTRPDTVVFLSGNVGGILYNKNNPGILIRDNLKMGINVLDACLEFNVKQVYITSTTCGYPKFCPIPFKEDDLWKDREEETNRPYAISKKTIMAMSQAYREQFGLKSTCLILTNLYGMHDHFDSKNNHVVPALIQKFVDAKESNSNKVYCFGTGIATRDLLYCKDLSDALTSMIIDKFDYSEPINIGTGKEISIYDLAHLIAKIVGFKGEIIFTGEVSDGQPRRCLDISRAKKLLNWESKTSLEEGLKSTINWYYEQKR